MASYEISKKNRFLPNLSNALVVLDLWWNPVFSQPALEKIGEKNVKYTIHLQT